MFELGAGADEDQEKSLILCLIGIPHLMSLNVFGFDALCVVITPALLVRADSLVGLDPRGACK